MQDWNDKYLQYGSGGWGGAIQPNEMVGPLAQGYTVAETDDGHKSEDGVGGPGPTSFGNDPTQTENPVDADHDVLTALDRWVTQGVAPEKLIGSGKTGAG